MKLRKRKICSKKCTSNNTQDGSLSDVMEEKRLRMDSRTFETPALENHGLALKIKSLQDENEELKKMNQQLKNKIGTLRSENLFIKCKLRTLQGSKLYFTIKRKNDLIKHWKDAYYMLKHPDKIVKKISEQLNVKKSRKFKISKEKQIQKRHLANKHAMCDDVLTDKVCIVERQPIQKQQVVEMQQKDGTSCLHFEQQIGGKTDEHTSTGNLSSTAMETTLMPSASDSSSPFQQRNMTPTTFATELHIKVEEDLESSFNNPEHGVNSDSDREDNPDGYRRGDTKPFMAPDLQFVKSENNQVLLHDDPGFTQLSERSCAPKHTESELCKDSDILDEETPDQITVHLSTQVPDISCNDPGLDQNDSVPAFKEEVADKDSSYQAKEEGIQIEQDNPAVLPEEDSKHVGEIGVIKVLPPGTGSSTAGQSGSQVVAQSEDSDNEIPEEEKLREEQNDQIFVRRLLKSDTDRFGRKKKNSRVYNSFHPCAFCKKVVLNFSQHVFGKSHKKEEDVIKIQKLNIRKPEEKKKRQDLMEVLRYKAAHNHNEQVLRQGKGEIFLARRLSDKDWKFDIQQYGPCPSCYGWFKLCTLWRHQVRCPGRLSKDEVKSKGLIVMQSQIFAKRLGDYASEEMKKEVFLKMKQDEVGMVAQNDPLILQLGNYWLQQNVGNKLQRGYYTSGAMRLVARLLLKLRELKPIKPNSMWEYLAPAYYENVIKATMCCCQKGDIDKQMQVPSNAIKLGHHLKKLCRIKESQAIINDNQTDQRHAQDFLKLMAQNWNGSVLKEATLTLQERKYHPDEDEDKHKCDDVEEDESGGKTILDRDSQFQDQEEYEVCDEIIKAFEEAWVEEDLPEGKRKTKVIQPRHRWTKEEEKELQKRFSEFFTTGKTPRTKNIERAKKASKQADGCIHKLKTGNIKKKVNNMILKQKKMR